MLSISETYLKLKLKIHKRKIANWNSTRQQVAPDNNDKIMSMENY